MPMVFTDRGVDEIAFRLLGLAPKVGARDLSRWTAMVRRLKSP